MTPTTTAPRGRAYLIDPGLVQVGASPEDKLSVAIDRLLGTTGEGIARACESRIFSDRTRARLRVKHAAAIATHREFPALRAESFGEFYQFVTGRSLEDAARRTELTRVRETATTTTDWATTLANALNRRLLTAYADAEYGERSLMRPGTAKDFRPHRVVNVGEVADIPTVAEAGPYLDITVPTETTLSYSVSKKGVLIPFTLEVIRNNDVEAVQRTIDSAGRAARRTLARRVWALWINNAVYGPDSVAWFNAAHNNIQSAALAEAEVIAAVRKLLDQTRPQSGEKLALPARPRSVWLVVPNSLWDVAYKLNQTTGSALHHLFGDENQYVIVNPLLTDANDWGVHLDSSQIESIRGDFLDGREEPEFTLADQPNAGALFTDDRIVYRLKHVYAVEVVEFRGAVKAVVA